MDWSRFVRDTELGYRKSSFVLCRSERKNVQTQNLFR